MKEIRKQLKVIKKDKNEFAWMLAVASVHNAVDETLVERRKQLVQLKAMPQFAKNANTDLTKIGERLIRKQEAVLPKLKKLATKQKDMAALYFEYDGLKRDRQELLNALAAEKHDYKDALAAEVNKLR